MAEQLLERGEWEKLVKKVDALTLNPHERAQKVWSLMLKELGDKVDSWDVLCFCAWYLSFMFTTLPDLEKYSKMLNVKVHQMHYQGNLWQDTNVIRAVDSDSKESERISRNYSAE